MGLKRITKKFLRFLIPTLIVLALIPLSVGEFTQAEKNPYSEDTLRCVIALDSIETLRTGYLTGYNYDLLKIFAADNYATVSIGFAEPGADYMDSLILDSIDILVTPSQDTIPEDIRTIPMTDSTGIWFVKYDRRKLRYLSLWMSRFLRDPGYFDFYNRFFACYNPYRRLRDKKILTPYDNLIKEYSDSIGWDWRLVASIAWNESRFKINMVSRQGAIGLMQLMPRTARKFGGQNLFDPEENIRCGTKLLEFLSDSFSGYDMAHEEQVKFTLAAYNAGEGRIQQVMSTAMKKNVDFRHWDTVASMFPLSESEGDSLNFSGLETAAYVRAVLGKYDMFRGVKKESLSPDSLSRVNPGYEQAWNEEQGENYHIRDSIGSDDGR